MTLYFESQTRALKLARFEVSEAEDNNYGDDGVARGLDEVKFAYVSGRVYVRGFSTISITSCPAVTS